MAKKRFTPRVIDGNGGPKPGPHAPAPMNVVLRKDAELAARVAYYSGRRDAMTTLAEEMKVLDGQFIAVTDMVEAIEKAAVEFEKVLAVLKQGEPPENETPEQTAARAAKERLILPS